MLRNDLYRVGMLVSSSGEPDINKNVPYLQQHEWGANNGLQDYRSNPRPVFVVHDRKDQRGVTDESESQCGAVVAISVREVGGRGEGDGGTEIADRTISVGVSLEE